MKKKLLTLFLAFIMILFTGSSFLVYAADGNVDNFPPMTKIDDVNLSSYKLNSYGQQYISLGETNFLKKYSAVYLYPRGIKVESGLRFTNRFKDAVIGNIKVGVTPGTVISALGKPNLDIADYDTNYTTNIIGYKTKDYYIIFHGTTKIDEISIVKRFHTPENYKNMLTKFVNNYILSDDTAYDDIQKFYNAYRLYGTKTAIHGGGWYISYPFGINFSNYFDGTTAQVYNDFEGDYANGNGVVAVDFINEDSVFKGQISYYEYTKYHDAQIKGHGKYSPNKKMIAYSDNESIYEYANVQIRFLDNSKPDKILRPGYFTENLRWINNRYLFFTAMFNGIYIYDFNTGRLRELTKEFEKSKVSFREFLFKSIDSKYIKYLDKNNKLIILSYSFDKKGNIIIKRIK